MVGVIALITTAVAIILFSISLNDVVNIMTARGASSLHFLMIGKAEDAYDRKAKLVLAPFERIKELERKLEKAEAALREIGELISEWCTNIDDASGFQYTSAWKAQVRHDCSEQIKAILDKL